MNRRKLSKQIKKYQFCDAYQELLENGYSFRFNSLTKDFPKLNSCQMYGFLMYAISRQEDVEKHLSICNYLYFMNPYVAGADSLIRWHLLRALEISPCDIRVLQDWIFGIYGGNPDNPFSQAELSEFEKRLNSLPSAMTTIQKDEYVFSVDVEKTKEYYRSHSCCACDYCQNYRSQIKGKFPKLEAFLSEFGIDIARPDETCPLEQDGRIDYSSVYYTVCGRITAMGPYEIDLHDSLFFNIVVFDGSVSPNEQKGEHFTLAVENMNLPWVLDKPLDEEKPPKHPKRKGMLFERLKRK